MIGVVFQFANEIIEVRVKGNELYFRTAQQQQWGDIKSLTLKKAGVLKEFPDLKDNEDWKEIAKDRFKDKIKSFETEEEKIDYIIEDLRKFGYKPMLKQKAGFRPQKIK